MKYSAKRHALLTSLSVLLLFLTLLGGLFALSVPQEWVYPYLQGDTQFNPDFGPLSCPRLLEPGEASSVCLSFDASRIDPENIEARLFFLRSRDLNQFTVFDGNPVLTGDAQNGSASVCWDVTQELFLEKGATQGTPVIFKVSVPAEPAGQGDSARVANACSIYLDRPVGGLTKPQSDVLGWCFVAINLLGAFMLWVNAHLGIGLNRVEWIKKILVLSGILLGLLCILYVMSKALLVEYSSFAAWASAWLCLLFMALVSCAIAIPLTFRHLNRMMQAQVDSHHP